LAIPFRFDPAFRVNDFTPFGATRSRPGVASLRATAILLSWSTGGRRLAEARPKPTDLALLSASSEEIARRRGTRQNGALRLFLSSTREFTVQARQEAMKIFKCLSLRCPWLVAGNDIKPLLKSFKIDAQLIVETTGDFE
jgi:hypothetical protein